MKYVILAFLLLLGGQIHVYAQITPNKAILAIIGEAESEGPRGMLAVACAIRNRGTLKGVYGLHAYRVIHHLYSSKTLRMARSAWRASAFEDVTSGATGWGNKADLDKFCSTKWWTRCQVTCIVGHQWFYKEVKNGKA